MQTPVAAVMCILIGSRMAMTESRVYWLNPLRVTAVLRGEEGHEIASCRTTSLLRRYGGCRSCRSDHHRGTW
jgi:hypothetical protein